MSASHSKNSFLGTVKTVKFHHIFRTLCKPSLANRRTLRDDDVLLFASLSLMKFGGGQPAYFFTTYMAGDEHILHCPDDPLF